MLRLLESRETEYRARLKGLLRQVDRLEAGHYKALAEELKRMRARLADALTQGTKYDALHAQRLLREAETVLLELEGKYRGALSGSIKTAYETGGQVADAALKRAGLDNLPLPSISAEQLFLAQNYSAALIKGITEDSLGKIDGILKRSLLGETTPFQVMKEIGGVLKKRTAYDLERITRTEINRALNLGTLARGKQLEKELPLRKYWLHEDDSRARESHVRIGRATNPDLGGEPIKADALFSVDGHRAAGPHDPSLPAAEVINCRCRVIYVPVEK